MSKKLLTTLTLLSTVALSACSTRGPVVNTANLSQLQNMTEANLPANQVFSGNNIRLKALKQTALGLGAQGGLAARADQINKSLKQQAGHLTEIFNFHPLMLANSVLPPVLVQSDKSVSVDGKDTLRISDHTYKIEQQAKFVTAAPTWRDYLWMSFSRPNPPNAVLLPKDSEERAIWQRYIQEGWKKGVTQADNIYKENLSKLRRDYQGMILYRKLLAEKMISSPFVAKTDLGITGNGSHMQINDRVLRIAAKPQLQTDAKKWKPIIVK